MNEKGNRTMNEKIKPEDLMVGDTVTIYEWLSHKDNSWKGDLIHIKAIELPFVFAIIQNDRGSKMKHKFDTRRVQFATVTDFYIEQFLWLSEEETER